MRRPAGIPIAVLGWYLSVVLSSSPAWAEESRSASGRERPDPVFNEILLTNDSVTAVDTFGNHWRYSFDSNVFERATPGPGVDRIETEPDQPEIPGVPVEERCTSERLVKSLEKKSVSVGYDEYVDGDIVAWGRVTVKGWVKGNVKSIQKRVTVTETGRVDGDVEAPEVVVKEGGEVGGRIIEGGSTIDIRDIAPSFSPDGIIIVLSLTAFLFLATFLIVSLMPRQLENFYLCYRESPVKTFFLGLLFIFLLPVLVAVLVVTIIGIPLTLLVPFAYLLAIILGVVSFGNQIGEHIARRYFGGIDHPTLQSLLGVLMLMLLWLVVAILMGSGEAVSQGFGIFFLVVATMISTVPVCCGVGTALLTRYGLRKYVVWSDRRYRRAETGVPTPAPPPIPADTGAFVPKPPPFPDGMTRPAAPLPPGGPSVPPPAPPSPPATNDGEHS
jgi:hypothetical protein